MMLEKTRGIIINFIKYRESSIISRIYTEEFGVQSFIINGVRSKKGKFSIALFQPLTVLDLVIYNKSTQTVKRISEAKCILPFSSITFDLRKTSIAVFISEVLLKAIKEEEGDKQLFQFLINTLISLESLPLNPDFHLIFLIRLSDFLGFGLSYQVQFVSSSAEEMRLLEDLKNADLKERVLPSNTVRNKLLDTLIKYYAFHIDGFDLKSSRILKEVFE